MDFLEQATQSYLDAFTTSLAIGLLIGSNANVTPMPGPGYAPAWLA
jgi:hypothetical protein